MVPLAMNVFLWLLMFIILLFGSVYIYVKHLFRYFEKRGIPFENPKFPFGNFKDTVCFKKSITYTVADIYAKNAHLKLVGFFSLWKRQILIRDLDLVKTVLIKDFDIFEDRGVYYNKEKDPLSAHLFSLEGNDWKYLRAKLTPTFTSRKIKGIYSIILDCAKQLSDFVEKRSSTSNNMECQSLFSKYSQTIVSATAFGIDNNCITDEDSTYSKMVKKMVEPTAERLYNFILFFNKHVAKFLNLRMVPTMVSEFFLGLIKDTIVFREESGIKRNDYLQNLIDLKNSNFEGAPMSLTEEEMAAQAFVFIMAGSEPTATTMSFCLYELSQNPEVQARLHKELDDLLDISYDSVKGCQYLDMVVNETLRKYPPLGFLTRECSQDYRVPNTDLVIEKGTQIYISLQGMQNDPDLFTDPEVFNPERFGKENKGDIKSYSFMPFGDGQRYCIGMRFGLMVVKTGLAVLLRRFKVCGKGLSSPLQVKPTTVITTVAGGLYMTFEDRN